MRSMLRLPSASYGANGPDLQPDDADLQPDGNDAEPSPTQPTESLTASHLALRAGAAPGGRLMQLLISRASDLPTLQSSAWIDYRPSDSLIAAQHPQAQINNNPAKRKPGRPRKNFSSEPTDDNLLKRKPGRPCKVAPSSPTTGPTRSIAQDRPRRTCQSVSSYAPQGRNSTSRRTLAPKTRVSTSDRTPVPEERDSTSDPAPAQFDRFIVDLSGPPPQIPLGYYGGVAAAILRGDFYFPGMAGDHSHPSGGRPATLASPDSQATITGDDRETYSPCEVTQAKTTTTSSRQLRSSRTLLSTYHADDEPTITPASIPQTPTRAAARPSGPKIRLSFNGGAKDGRRKENRVYVPRTPSAKIGGPALRPITPNVSASTRTKNWKRYGTTRPTNITSYGGARVRGSRRGKQVTQTQTQTQVEEPAVVQHADDDAVVKDEDAGDAELMEAEDVDDGGEMETEDAVDNDDVMETEHADEDL